MDCLGGWQRGGFAAQRPSATEHDFTALMRDIDTLVVDKTGTLTLGHPALTDFIAEGISENEALASVAGVEQLSEHPIALAIVEGAKARSLAPRTVTAFEAVNGLGVLAEVDGKRVLVGSRGFLAQRNVDTRRWEERAEAWQGHRCGTEGQPGDRGLGDGAG